MLRRRPPCAERSDSAKQGKAAEAFPAADARRQGRHRRRRVPGRALLSRRRRRAAQPGGRCPLAGARGHPWLRRSAGAAAARLHLAAWPGQGRRRRRCSSADRLFAAEAPADPDFEAALKWARQAARPVPPQGQALLAYILTCGPETMRDLDAAHRWYERSAAAGCPEGHLGYALSLARRTPDEPAGTQVADHLRHAAEAELPTAIYLLGVLTEQGLGVAADPARAAQLYRQAARKAIARLKLRWGLALMEGRGVEQDLVAGESWLRRAALAGDSAGGGTGRRSLCPERPAAAELSRGRELVSPRRRGGHQAAARALGSLYLTGAGVPQDKGGGALVARRRRGGRTGLASGLCQSGAAGSGRSGGSGPGCRMVRASGRLRRSRRCLQSRASAWPRASASSATSSRRRNGCATPPRALPRPNTCTAACWPRAAAWPPTSGGARWFTRAADAGLADAQVALAEMMVNGRGGPRSPAAALDLFEAAAEGHSGAMFALGALHGGGHGLPTDRAIAQRWFRAAAELGHGHAQLMLGRYLAAGVAGELDQRRRRLGSSAPPRRASPRRSRINYKHEPVGAIFTAPRPIETV